MSQLEISTEETQRLLSAEEEIRLLDCREPSEWETARIDGATLLPMSEMQERVAEIEDWKSDKIVVYCHHGGRSLRVAMWLRGHGFSETLSMSGGIDEWSLRIDDRIPRY